MTTITDRMTSDIKHDAIADLETALYTISRSEPVWDKTRQQLGYNNVTHNLARELRQRRFGKIATFDYSVVGEKDGHKIIIYYQPGCNVHGFGVLDVDESVCIETTVTDLVEWIIPTDVVTIETSLRIDHIREIVSNTQKLFA